MTRDWKAELARFVDHSQIGLSGKAVMNFYKIRTTEFCLSYYFARRLGRDRTLTRIGLPITMRGPNNVPALISARHS